jgi:hypothetical protein
LDIDSKGRRRRVSAAVEKPFGVGFCARGDGGPAAAS